MKLPHLSSSLSKQRTQGDGPTFASKKATRLAPSWVRRIPRSTPVCQQTLASGSASSTMKTKTCIAVIKHSQLSTCKRHSHQSNQPRISSCQLTGQTTGSSMNTRSSLTTTRAHSLSRTRDSVAAAVSHTSRSSRRRVAASRVTLCTHRVTLVGHCQLECRHLEVSKRSSLAEISADLASEQS